MSKNASDQSLFQCPVRTSGSKPRVAAAMDGAVRDRRQRIKHDYHGTPRPGLDDSLYHPGDRIEHQISQTAT